MKNEQSSSVNLTSYFKRKIVTDQGKTANFFFTDNVGYGFETEDGEITLQEKFSEREYDLLLDMFYAQF